MVHPFDPSYFKEPFSTLTDECLALADTPDTPQLPHGRRRYVVDTPGACTVYRRRPEHTPLYRTVQGRLETYLELTQEGQGEGVPQYVEREFRRYLECGILAHG